MRSALKRMMVVMAVTLLSACGTQEPSAAPEDESLGSTESALAVCGLNTCPSGYAPVGYTCDDACNTSGTKCSEAGWNNKSLCTAYTDLVGVSYVNCVSACPRPPNASVDTHYVSGYTTTSACVGDPRYPPRYTNSAQCQPLPSSGSVQACGSCPSSWRTTSMGSPDPRCTTSWGAIQNLVTCTK
jgi:hypothetical protein